MADRRVCDRLQGSLTTKAPAAFLQCKMVAIGPERKCLLWVGNLGEQL